MSGSNQAPAGARAAIAACPELAGVDSVLLLVSELVTNSVKHAAAESIELNLFSDPHTVRVEVIDDGPGFDPYVSPEPAHGGLGLYFVDKLADRWGVDTGAPTRIWFEVDK